jgi:hypothetical protein
LRTEIANTQERTHLDRRIEGAIKASAEAIKARKAAALSFIILLAAGTAVCLG